MCAPIAASNRSNKSYSKVADKFMVDESLNAVYETTPFMTSQGPVRGPFKGIIA
jgi:hypothetical protein